MGRRPWLAGLAVLMLVVVAGAALLAASVARVSNRHSAAVSVLESTRRHNNAVHDSLTDPKLTAQLNNAQSVQEQKAAMDDYRAQMSGGIKTVESQLAELRAVRADLRAADGDPLTFTGRPTLSRDRERVEAATNAFESADQFLTISDRHLLVFNATLAALAELDNVHAFLDAHNLSGGLALIPQLKQQLQSAATVAQNPQVPPQLRALVEALIHAVDDFNQALLALQSNDNAALARLRPALDADARAVDDSFDIKGLNEFQHQLLDPYRHRYETEMTKAGFVTKTA